MKHSKEDREQALRLVHELVKPGDTLYTVLRHVSRSGMQREISTFITPADGVPRCLDWHVSRIIGERIGKHDGVVIGGCGMDMGFQMVYLLSSAMFPDGFTCTGKNEKEHRYCPSNDHSNGDRNYRPHKHSSGGYALKQRWM